MEMETEAAKEFNSSCTDLLNKLISHLIAYEKSYLQLQEFTNYADEHLSPGYVSGNEFHSMCVHGHSLSLVTLQEFHEVCNYPKTNWRIGLSHTIVEGDSTINPELITGQDSTNFTLDLLKTAKANVTLLLVDIGKNHPLLKPHEIWGCIPHAGLPTTWMRALLDLKTLKQDITIPSVPVLREGSLNS